MTVTDNVTLVGNVLLNNHVLSDFSTGAYAYNAFVPHLSDYNSWEVSAKVITGSGYSSTRSYSIIVCGDVDRGLNRNCGFLLRIYPKKFNLVVERYTNSYQDAVDLYSDTIQDNTEYIVKGRFTGSRYELEVNGTVVAYKDATWKGLYNASRMPQLAIGAHSIYSGTSDASPAFIGSIDLTKCYFKANGNVLWNGVERSKRYYSPARKGANDLINSTYDSSTKMVTSNSGWYGRTYNTGDNWVAYGTITADGLGFIPSGGIFAPLTNNLITNLTGYDALILGNRRSDGSIIPKVIVSGMSYNDAYFNPTLSVFNTGQVRFIQGTYVNINQQTSMSASITDSRYTSSQVGSLAFNQIWRKEGYYRIRQGRPNGSRGSYYVPTTAQETVLDECDTVLLMPYNSNQTTKTYASFLQLQEEKSIFEITQTDYDNAVTNSIEPKNASSGFYIPARKRNVQIVNTSILNLNSGTMGSDYTMSFDNENARPYTVDVMPLDTADNWEWRTKFSRIDGGANYSAIIGHTNTNYCSAPYIQVVKQESGMTPYSADIVIPITSSTYIGSENYNHTFSANTPYYVKMGFTGTEYYLDVNTSGWDTPFERWSSYQSTSKCYIRSGTKTQFMSRYNNRLYGTIDFKETRLFINGQVYWEYITDKIVNNYYIPTRKDNS